MKNLIKQLLRENLQQADKLYFNNNKFSPEMRQVILNITHGDVYTKLVTDLLFFYFRGENNPDPNGSVYNNVINSVKKFYHNLKTYDKNRLPIKGNLLDYSIDNNDPWHITDLFSMLDWRNLAIETLNDLPSVVIRNIKEIREPISHRYEIENTTRNLRTLRDLLKSFPENKRDELTRKVASSKESLISMVEIARHFHDSFLNLDEFDKDDLMYEIKEQNAVIKQNKNNILVVKIKDEEAAQALSCGVTWCFARPNSTEFWEDYTQMGYLYYIYDFNKEPTDALFLMTFIPHTYEVYAGTNVAVEALDIENGYDYLQKIGVNTEIFDKDWEKATKPKKEPKPKGDPNQLSLDLHEEYSYDDDEEDYYYYDDEQYFKPKLSKEVKRLSQPFVGRNVIWYGKPGNMVWLSKDEVEGMWGNIYDSKKMESLVELIRTYPEKVELECSYGLGSIIGFIQIKEELESYYGGNFEVDYDGTDEPATTGNDELNQYVGKPMDEMSWYDLDWLNDDIENQDELAVFFENNKFALIEGKSVEDLLREFNSFNPSPIQIECFKEFLDMNKALLEAENNNEGDFNKFKVQLRDGHHRVFAAFEAGEKYVCVNLTDEDIEKYQGHYTLVK